MQNTIYTKKIYLYDSIYLKKQRLCKVNSPE